MHPYLVVGVEFGPAIVTRLMERIPAERLDESLDADRFTPREVVAHLADWEPIMRERIAAAVTSPGSIVQAYDEGQMALDHGYAESDWRAQCAVFADERRVTVEYLRGLESNAWRRTATHPERGIQSAEDLANTLLGHDLYHIEQLSTYLD